MRATHTGRPCSRDVGLLVAAVSAACAHRPLPASLPLLSLSHSLQFQTAFQSLGIVTALNEPWSAKDGFMYAAEQFSSPHTAVLMFEFRQDLVVQEEWRAKVVQQTEKVLREAGHK